MIPYPSEPDFWYPVLDTVRERYARAGREPDHLYPIWPIRMCNDIKDGMSLEAARAKHLRELDRALGLTTDPDTPQAHPGPLIGPLRLEGRVYVDNSGPVLPLFCHFGEAFSAFVRRPDDVRRQLDAIANGGYHGIRFWDVLGYYDAAWRGREVTPIAFPSRANAHVPATPSYYDHLAAFLHACHDRQLKVMHDRGDLNSWSISQKRAHLRDVGALYKSLGAMGHDVLAGLWACNESWQNGVDTPDEAIGMLHAFEQGAGGLPAIRGLSAPAEQEELEPLRAWSQHPATVVTIHPLRDRNRKRMLEHYFTDGYGACQAIGKPGWMTEPIGPGSGVTVGQENDPEMLALLAAISLVAGQAYTYMSSPGVFWDSPIEEQPGFHETVSLVESLPFDLMRWHTIHHSGERWRGTRVFVANDHERCDGVQHRDGRFVYVLYGERGVPSLPAERAAHVETVYSGRIGSVVMGQVR